MPNTTGQESRNEVLARWCIRRVLAKTTPASIRQWVETGGDFGLAVHLSAKDLLPKEGEEEGPDTDWATVAALEAVVMASDPDRNLDGRWVSWVMRASSTSRYRRVWRSWKAAYPWPEGDLWSEDHDEPEPWTVWTPWATLAGKAEEAAQMIALSYVEQVPPTLSLTTLRSLLGESGPRPPFVIDRAWLLREVWRSQGARGDLLNVGIDYCNGHRECF